MPHATDDMIRRLEDDLNERVAAREAIIATAQNAGRDMNEAELQTISDLKDRTLVIRSQLGVLEESQTMTAETQARMNQLDSAYRTTRKQASDPQVEYRSAGEWVCDMHSAHTGNRDARERLEQFELAAAHQKTSDNAGVIPTPVVGDVINFVDANRPIVTAIGPMDMPGQNWYLPMVTQQPLIGLQGSAGAAADEKSELVSQKMTITRLTGTAVTYGGYVNVSRQNIDFSRPDIMDLVIQGLANNYALQTETATATALDASASTNVGYGASPTAATLTTALWSAAATIYAATKNPGNLVLAVAADRLAVFGPLFPPYNAQNAQSSAGLLAGQFGSDIVGNIAGVRLIMSPGLASGKSFLFSPAAVKVFEQRVGSLTATEPSVMGVQVGYGGYFTPVLVPAGGVTTNGVIELTAT